MPEIFKPEIRKLIDDFAAEHRLDVFTLEGQVAFALYTQSGGICTKYLVYFKRQGYKWPENLDMGREHSAHPTVIAVELEACWNHTQILKHLKEVYKRG